MWNKIHSAEDILIEKHFNLPFLIYIYIYIYTLAHWHTHTHTHTYIYIYINIDDLYIKACTHYECVISSRYLYLRENDKQLFKINKSHDALLGKFSFTSNPNFLYLHERCFSFLQFFYFLLTRGPRFSPGCSFVSVDYLLFIILISRYTHNTHTHTHTNIYIYIYTCVCVCVCVSS